MAGWLGATMVWGGAARGAVYDFSSGGGVQHFAYGISLFLPVPPTTSTLPPSQVSVASYTSMETSEDVRYSTGRVDGTGNTLAPATRFVFTISELRSRVTRLDVRWEGAADEDGVQQVWVWNTVTNAYVLIGSQVEVISPLDGTVNGSISANAADFVDATNRVTVLASHDSDDVTLFTDYVRCNCLARFEGSDPRF